MEAIDGPSWTSLFAPTTPLIELVIRGTVMYLFLFGLIRMAYKRQAGAVSMTDLLVIVLLADAAQNAIAGEYTTVTEGALLVAVIVAWSIGLEWLGFRFDIVERVIHPPPLALVEHGRMIRRNMREELITEEELMTKLREQGVEELARVKRAMMEGDGQLSVILYEGPPNPPRGTRGRRLFL